MKRNALTTLIVCLTLLSCKHSDPNPAEGVTFLTVTQVTPYSGITWAFASNRDGKVLDASQVTAGAPITFKSLLSVDDSISFTIVKIDTVIGMDFYKFVTYGSISKGSTIKFDNPIGDGESTGGNPVYSGTAQIIIEDSPVTANFQNPLYFSDGVEFFFGGTPNEATHTFTMSIPLNSSHSDLLVSGYNGPTPVYSWFQGLANGQSVSRSFNDFTPYEKTIPLDFENVVGAANAGGYNFGFLYVDPNSPGVVPSLGYLEGFDSYYLTVSSNGTNYTKWGALNLNVSLPQHTFDVISPALKNFTFNFSGPYTNKTARWQYIVPNEIWVIWDFQSGKSPFPTITELPPAFVTAYPAVNLNKLEFGSIDFIHRLDGGDYNKHVQEEMSMQRGPGEFYDFRYTN